MNTRIRSHQRGFSLIEVTLAMALIASVVTSLMLIMGMASEAANRATKMTTVGHILTDVHQRIEGKPLENGPVMDKGQTVEDAAFFYDVEGVYVGIDAPEDRILSRTYRVEVDLATPTHHDAEHAEGLKAVTIRILWPVDSESGRPLAKTGSNVESMTYFVTTLTGPNWEEVDPQYIPTIDL